MTLAEELSFVLAWWAACSVAVLVIVVAGVVRLVRR